MIDLSKQQEIAEWLMNCPQFATLWNISAEAVDGANVILPFGTSSRRNILEKTDVAGWYEGEFRPLPSVYEEYQINCYKSFTNNDNIFNILKLDEVELAVDWIIEQDELQNFPQISNKKVIAVEPFPFIPQIRGVDPETGLICYYITLRITYLNPAKGRVVTWQM